MRTSIVKFILAMGALGLLYQNCSAVHQSDSSLSSFQACNLILKDQFTRGYHEFLKTNCNTCHVSNGTGNGEFADSSLEKAFDAFLVRGNNLVGERARDPNHQSPFTGHQHDAHLTELDQGWGAAKLQADTCIANAGITIDNNIEDGVVPEDPKPTSGSVRTFIKLIDDPDDNNTITDGRNIVWNLEDEIANPSNLSFPGATLQVNVAGLTSSTGDVSYVISNPRLTAGVDPIHIIFIEFYINNQLVSEATSFHSINRRVPAGQQRSLAVGGTIFPFRVRSTDTISLSIGILEAVEFDPPTYQDLVAAGGVFGDNCMSCHNGNSGVSTPQASFDIANYNNGPAPYNFLSVYDGNMVAPYSPNNSKIFQRMNDLQSPMPQDKGILPDADLEQVLWWIQDGATECGYDNNGNVRGSCP